MNLINKNLHCLFILFFCVGLFSCQTWDLNSHNEDGPPKYELDTDDINEITPQNEPKSKKGNAPVYRVLGKTYYVQPSAEGYQETGVASWYGRKFHGRLTSNGEIYDMFQMTAAHKELPIPTYLKVTNLHSRRSIVVRVNDRGPFVPNRIIDLSYAAAKKLGFSSSGTALVHLEAINPQDYDEFDIDEIDAFEQPHNAYLQVGAFSNFDNAKSLQQDIATSLDMPTTINEDTNNNQTMYKVHAGPFTTIEESDTAYYKLVSQGFNEPVSIITKKYA